MAAMSWRWSACGRSATLRRRRANDNWIGEARMANHHPLSRQEQQGIVVLWRRGKTAISMCLRA